MTEYKSTREVQFKWRANSQLHTEGWRKIQARQNRGRRGVRKMLEWRRLNATANNIQRVRDFHFVIVVEGEGQIMGQPASIGHQLVDW